MKYAWIENEKIRDIAPDEPSEIYHPDVAIFYNTQVPDDAENGDGWINNALIKAPPPPPPIPAPRTWTAENIRSGLTLTEKVKWDNNSAPEITTAKLEMEQLQELAHTTAVLQMLVTANVISQDSMNKILG